MKVDDIIKPTSSLNKLSTHTTPSKQLPYPGESNSSSMSGSEKKPSTPTPVLSQPPKAPTNFGMNRVNSAIMSASVHGTASSKLETKRKSPPRKLHGRQGSADKTRQPLKDTPNSKCSDNIRVEEELHQISDPCSTEKRKLKPSISPRPDDENSFFSFANPNDQLTPGINASSSDLNLTSKFNAEQASPTQ